MWSNRANEPSRTADSLEALHRFALLTACATFALIFVGGLVTSTGSALAVPDWPLSFGRFFPKMVGGVLYEHGHRMVAALVTLLTLGLMVWTLRVESRRYARLIAVGAFCLIVIQAVLGGLTVLLKLPLAIAVAHAACAQAFFCLVVAFCVVTSQYWQKARAIATQGSPFSLPKLALLTTIFVYAQILIGAVMRHMGAGLAIPDFPLSFGHIVPPVFPTPVAINFAHRVGALLVATLVTLTVVRVLRFHRDQPELFRISLLLGGLLVVQLGLGATTVWSMRAVIPTTAHVAVGAALLATSLVLTMRAFRLMSPVRLQGAVPLQAQMQRVQGRVRA